MMRNAQKEQIEKFLTVLKSMQKELQNLSNQRKPLEQRYVEVIFALFQESLQGISILQKQFQEEKSSQLVLLFETYGKLLSKLKDSLCLLETKSQTTSLRADVSTVVASSISTRVPNNSFLEQIEAYQNDLDSLLEEIKQKFQKISVKKEVVFLPYKASMWDSLESVWKAASKEENCEAYVIPIPYFDKKADGSFGKLHYEGDLYPADVPITDYQTFDLAKHRPDRIFIHNPYDECNLVTSVHPAFYSKKLKQYTEELIYIPYFILEEISLENEEALKNMEKFCKLPAMLYADKVIVQSEQMKQVYVKVLTEWAGEETKEQWEEKIFGFGSPKEDKLLTSQKEAIVIPDDWKAVIDKSNGTRKKVIFYNTSLSTFLQQKEQYFKKVKDVLAVFKESREEIALLWRPHPLMEATIESIHPELKEMYLEIVETYRKEQWGIYDDTPDLDRAIHLADAYYGDPSSVVQLCQKTNIPIMIQNVNIIYQEEENKC